MYYVLAAVLGYLIGCSSMAFYISKLKQVDVSKEGSGNLGASNTMVLLGWRAGIAVAVHDILKATLAVLLAKWLFPQLPYAGAVAGVMAVLGHIFPFYLKFKGGKGFASFFGVALALDWKFALVLAVVLLVITLVTDYIVCSTMTAAFAIPLYLGIVGRSLLLTAILLVPTVVMVFKHRENFVRLRNGTEVGLRSARKGEHRIQ